MSESARIKFARPKFSSSNRQERPEICRTVNGKEPQTQPSCCVQIPEVMQSAVLSEQEVDRHMKYYGEEKAITGTFSKIL